MPYDVNKFIMMALTNQFFKTGISKPILPYEQEAPKEDTISAANNDSTSLDNIDIVSNDRYSMLSNMILWLDANQNAGFNTFDPQATSWKNLVIRDDKLPDMTFYTKNDSALISSYNSENFTWGNVIKESNDCKCLSVANSDKVFGRCIPKEDTGYTRSEFIDLLNTDCSNSPNSDGNGRYTIDFSIRVKDMTAGISPISILSNDIPFINLKYFRDGESYGNLIFKNPENKVLVQDSRLGADNYIYVAIRPKNSAIINEFSILVSSGSIAGADSQFPYTLNIDINNISEEITPNAIVGIFLNKLISNKNSSINFCSLRMYDVALTDLQIARNFKLDLAKYKLPFISGSTAETNKPRVN